MIKMKKASVYSLIKSSIKDENYKGTRVIVFDENHNLILAEEIEKITFKMVVMMEQYELVEWTTDWKKGDDKIKTTIIFGRKVLEVSL
jgi:hypothetical protein